MAFSQLIYPFLVFIAILAYGSRSYATDPQQVTWKTFLPYTPMPASLVDATANSNTNNTVNGDWAVSEEVVIMDYDGQSGHCKVPAGPHGVQGHKHLMHSRFLLREDLTLGAQVTVQLKAAEGGISSKFSTLSTSQADQTLPAFNSANLSEILDFFHVAPQSEPAVIIQDTLARCEKKDALDGEVQYCATSLDNLLWNVCLHLRCPRVKAISATSTNKGSLPYLIEEVTELATDKSSMICHQLGYPHAVYFCHQPPTTTTYSVKLKGLVDAGKEEVAFVVCHERTEKWSPKYIGFQVMGVKPGTPLCHYLQYHDTVFYV